MIKLPDELILIIFNFIEKITDKRQLLRTCNLYNTITKKLFNHTENNFILKHKLKQNYYCMENFTSELCYDLYFDRIPVRYFNRNNSQLMVLLVKHGQLDLLKFAVKNGCSLNFNTSTVAAYYGHLDVLKWARDMGCDWSSHVCACAAQNGHLNILKWARNNDCRWDAYTCAYAAQNGHLDVLIWARENGCSWDKYTCSYAASHGHLNVLIWARKNGCEWNTDVCYYAKYNKHFEVLKWAIENGCLGSHLCEKYI